MVWSGQKLFLKNVLGVSDPIPNFQPSFISGPQRDSFCMLCPSSVLESCAFHLTLLGEGWQECPLCSLSSLGLGQPLFPGSQRWDCSVILSHPQAYMFGFFPPPLTLLPAHIRETRLICPFSVTNLPLFFLREGGPQLSFMFFDHMDMLLLLLVSYSECRLPSGHTQERPFREETVSEYQFHAGLWAQSITFLG